MPPIVPPGWSNVCLQERNGGQGGGSSAYCRTARRAGGAGDHRRGGIVIIETEHGEGTGDPANSGPPVQKAWRSKRFRISAIAAAVILATGLGFGVGRVIGLGNTVILAAIPQPATGQDAFIEDDDGIAQDNQENILQATAPGMVHILSGGTSVGIGLVLTESAKVLTTYQPVAGASNLAAEYVLSRQTFSATVIGADPAAGLALLQLQGGAGRAFSSVTVGDSGPPRK